MGVNSAATRFWALNMREESLISLGEIAIGWSTTEESIRKLLWLYVGTDRPTFEILVRGLRPVDVERLLRDFIKEQEPNKFLRKDIETALIWVGILRGNRNDSLHGANVHNGAGNWPLSELREIGSQMTLCVPLLIELYEKASKFIVARATSETPLGDEDFPEFMVAYEPISWPKNPKKIKPWGHK
jgi:hypothetical protein